MVPAERSTAQPGQVRSSDCWNDQSAACGDVIRVIDVSVAGVDLPVADDIKVLGVVLDRRLTCRRWRDRTITMHRPSDTFDDSTPADYGTGTDTGL